MTRLAIIFSLLFVTPTWAETILYCQDELHTGSFYKNGRHMTGECKKMRHTVKFDEKTMTLSGFEKDALSCKAPYEYVRPDIIYCADKFADRRFHFDKKSLRYSAYSISFTSWIEGKSDTATIQHGTCEKF